MFNKKYLCIFLVKVNKKAHLFMNFLDFYLLLRYVWFQSDISRMHYTNSSLKRTRISRLFE